MACMTYRDHPLPQLVPLHPRLRRLLQHQGSGAPVDQQIYYSETRISTNVGLTENSDDIFSTLSAVGDVLEQSGWVESSVTA